MSNFILKFTPIRTFDDVIRRDGDLMWKIMENIHWTLLRIGELHKCLTFYIHVYPFLKQCTFLPIEVWVWVWSKITQKYTGKPWIWTLDIFIKKFKNKTYSLYRSICLYMSLETIESKKFFRTINEKEQ